MIDPGNESLEDYEIVDIYDEGDTCIVYDLEDEQYVYLVEE